MANTYGPKFPPAGTPPTVTPPINDPLTDHTGQTSQSWIGYFQQAADMLANSTGGGATLAAANSAQTAASAAQISAARAAQQIADLLASPPVWVIGDYRQTSLATLGVQWLKCDGRYMFTADYPDLSAILLPITGGGPQAGQFALPIIPTINQPAPNDALVVLSTWIRAL